MVKKPVFLVVNGPNLNLLGEREPGVYGKETLQDLQDQLIGHSQKNGYSVKCFQSNSEGMLIDIMQEHRNHAEGIVLNAGAYTHYSYAIRDCISALEIPVIEVHISNPEAREEFRHKSVISPVVAGKIAGFGLYGYVMALDALLNIAANERQDPVCRKESS